MISHSITTLTETNSRFPISIQSILCSSLCLILPSTLQTSLLQIKWLSLNSQMLFLLSYSSAATWISGRSGWRRLFVGVVYHQVGLAATTFKKCNRYACIFQLLCRKNRLLYCNWPPAGGSWQTTSRKDVLWTLSLHQMWCPLDTLECCLHTSRLPWPTSNRPCLPIVVNNRGRTEEKEPQRSKRHNFLII